MNAPCACGHEKADHQTRIGDHYSRPYRTPCGAENCQCLGFHVSPEGRFWSKVDKSADCWLWTSTQDRLGYGYFRYEGRQVAAYRVAWILSNGPIPDGLWVLHRCDNPPCVNPDHLFIGTHADNVADMVAKGRQTIGTKNPRAKLTERDVLAIRASTEINRVLAQRFGVGPTTISFIKTRTNWGWLTETRE